MLDAARRFAVIAALTLPQAALAGDLAPPGAPGPTMKTLDEVEARIPLNDVHTPGDGNSVFRIVSPGSYYLTGDLVVPDAGQTTGIEIASNDVSIDLNGYTIRSAPSLALAIAPTDNPDSGESVVRYNGIAIFNGAIRETNVGVLGVRQTPDGFTLLEKVTIRDLRVIGTANTGLLLGEDSVVENCVVDVAGGVGVSAPRGAVSDCRVVSAGTAGIAATGASITNCSVLVTADNAVGLDLRESVASDVTVEASFTATATTGVEAEDSVVVDCVVFDADTAYDAAGTPSLLRGCAAFNTGAPTANAASATLVDNNF